MPTQTFYWVGATAASFNSFSWDVAANWRVLVPGGGGPTANPKATLETATRCPMGGDMVFFGRPYGPSNVGLPAPFVIYSPCLFGGVTTAASKLWSGATAGGTTFERVGTISAYVAPSYPLFGIGGAINSVIMTQWADYLWKTTGVTNSPFVFNGATSASGQAWSSPSWFGTTAGLSYANQPSYSINFRGTWNASAKSSTYTIITGVTAQIAGATTSAYDGSSNRLYIGNINIPTAYTSPQFTGATTPRNEGDNMVYTTGLSGPYAWNGWGTSTQTNDTYYSGPISVSGHWNAIRAMTAPRNLSLIHYAKTNVIDLAPPTSIVAAATAGQMGVYRSASQTKVFDIAYLLHGAAATARVINIDNVDQIHSVGVRILGDITPTGGFVCSLPEGVSGGASGGIQLPNGSFRITPPARLGQQYDIDDMGGVTQGSYSSFMDKAVVYFGYPQPQGDTDSTTITNLYAEAGATTPVEYTILGNYQSTTATVKHGTLSFSEDIPSLAGITISNLQLFGNAEFNMANARNYVGETTVDINAQSNDCVIKPVAGTSLKVGNIYAELVLRKR